MLWNRLIDPFLFLNLPPNLPCIPPTHQHQPAFLINLVPSFTPIAPEYHPHIPILLRNIPLHLTFSIRNTSIHLPPSLRKTLLHLPISVWNTPSSFKYPLRSEIPPSPTLLLRNKPLPTLLLRFTPSLTPFATEYPSLTPSAPFRVPIPVPYRPSLRFPRQINAPNPELFQGRIIIGSTAFTEPISNSKCAQEVASSDTQFPGSMYRNCTMAPKTTPPGK